ncbi:MAG TPA: permease-like cell division protein FtsX [Chitinophagales bacterium]|nr:permease-like cell division protein FtsX [Chitinophagales bacterium]
MSEELHQKVPKKKKPSFIYAIISIAMILFIIGLFSSSVLFTRSYYNKLKESIQIDIYLKDDISDSAKNSLTQYLEHQRFLSKVKYISKDESAQEFKKAYNQDFEQILGNNPLPAAFRINLKAENSNEEFAKDLKYKLQGMDGVQEVYYNALAFKTVGTQINPIFWGILVLCLVLLIVAFLIIDNTIKLLMYSQRNTIRTMQLIGATDGFIIKPYIWRSAVIGIISAIVAILILALLIYLTIYKFSLEISATDFVNLSLIALGLVVFGILIAVISTYFSVNKYLKVKLDELY